MVVFEHEDRERVLGHLKAHNVPSYNPLLKNKLNLKVINGSEQNFRKILEIRVFSTPYPCLRYRSIVSNIFLEEFKIRVHHPIDQIVLQDIPLFPAASQLGN